MLGINSQGNLLLPSKLIERCRSQKNNLNLLNFLFKIKTIYNRIKYNSYLKELYELNCVKKTNHKIIVEYFLVNTIDKSKNIQILQLFLKEKLNYNSIIVYEKVLGKNFKTPWRHLGTLNNEVLIGK